MPLPTFSFLLYLPDLLDHPLHQYRHVTDFDPIRTSTATYLHSHISHFLTQKVTQRIDLHKELPSYKPSRDAELYLGLDPQARVEEYYYFSPTSAAQPWTIRKDWEDIPWADIILRKGRVFKLPWPKQLTAFDRFEHFFRAGWITIYVGHDPTPNADDHEWTVLEEVIPPEKDVEEVRARSNWREQMMAVQVGHQLGGKFVHHTLATDLEAIDQIKSMTTDEALIARIQQEKGIDLAAGEPVWDVGLSEVRRWKRERYFRRRVPREGRVGEEVGEVLQESLGVRRGWGGVEEEGRKVSEGWDSGVGMSEEGEWPNTGERGSGASGGNGVRKRTSWREA